MSTETRIELIPLRMAGPELRAAYRRATDLWGGAGRPAVAIQIVQCFSQRPAYVEPIALGYYYSGWGGRLPRSVRESVAVLVSRYNDCFY
ncbi:MAG: hypothetical protein V3R77_01115 [Candidatus Binatia bacterium]